MVKVYEKAAHQSGSEEEELYKLNDEIPYLTDPCTTGVNISLDQLAGQDLVNIWPEAGLAYIGRQFGGLTLLHPDNSQRTKMERSTDQRNLKVYLKAGGVLEGKISTIASTNPAKYFEVDNSDKTIFSNNGDILAIKKILLVHAVQRPVLINGDNIPASFKEEYKLAGFQPQKRVPKEVKARFTLALKETDVLEFPFATTGTLFLNGFWDEKITDLGETNGFRVEKRSLSVLISNLSANNGSELVTKLKYEKDRVAGHEAETRAMLEAFTNFAHEFSDTKFRKVTYELIAESRFKQYFPEASNFSVKGLFDKPMIIENTIQCPQLLIDSIVPVFNWSLTDVLAIRKQNLVRIYFHGDWFLTGAQEQVAILYLKDSNTVTDECEGMVSSIGKDASTITTSSFNARTKSLNEDSFLSLDGSKQLVKSEVVPSESIDLRLLDREASNFIQPVTGKADFPVCASLYDPKFDTRRKKFFIDVYLAEEVVQNNYWPFLKLALSRYQGNSIVEKGLFDYRFSPVAMAPKVPLLPARSVDIKNKRFVIDDTLRNNYMSRKLEFYLRLEISSASELTSLVIDGITSPAVSVRIDEFKDGSLGYRKTIGEINQIIKQYKAKRVFLEEFEVYEKEDFDIKSISDPVLGCPLNYSPREDIRKRLVFSYEFN